MFSLSGSNSKSSLWRLALFMLCFILQFLSSQQTYRNALAPTRADFAISTLSTEEKEKFVDEHNKFRGMVNPPAADMEYLFWDDDLANLAQMWTNKCIWDHGFLKFGNEYPYPVNYTGRIGQNLAREYSKLPDPADRLERWYNENYRYSYQTGYCSGSPPCGHYTQMTWAKAKYVGCGVNVCANFRYRYALNSDGGSYVACDYDKIQIAGHTHRYHYQQGKPCSKCASGKGFCYKNLCRDCDDFDKACGTTLTQAMCTSQSDLMEKKCPKMCNLCKCRDLQCQNGGTVNKQTCVCSCPPRWTGTDCSDICQDRDDPQFTCKQLIRSENDCSSEYMKHRCEASCGYCDDGSGTFTTTVAPMTTTTPKPVHPRPEAPINPGPNLPVPTKPAPQVCTVDLNSGCEMWAARGECEHNPLWMIPNCCVSCKHHQAPKDCADSYSNTSCPRWAYFGECERNRWWMMDNCRKSCNQCGDCKDTDPQCPSWALLGQCSSGDRLTWMNTNCRDSCGLCRVYDRHTECPAWSVTEECTKSNWTWMADHCPLSCEVPVSEALFCGGKSDGDYQAPTSCQAYIACSYGVTSHVACPAGQTFDTVKRICDSADLANCTVVNPSKKSKSTWRVIWTLKRG